MSKEKNSKNNVVIGRGGFGEVYADPENVKAVWKYTRPDKNRKINSLENEAAIYLELLHSCPAAPFYPLLYQLKYENSALCLQLEKKGQTLSAFFKKNPLPTYPLFRRTASKLFGLLKNLHSTGLVHRDIKPSNILLGGIAEEVVGDAVPDFFLIDFGLSKNDCERNSKFEGTRKYASPWSYSRERNFSHLDDIISLLYVLSEWYSGEKLPWAQEKDLAKVKRAKMQWTPEKRLPPEMHRACKLIQGVLEAGNKALTINETYSLLSSSYK